MSGPKPDALPLGDTENWRVVRLELTALVPQTRVLTN